MCGRYASTRSAADLAALFEVEDLTDGDLVPDYNVAPTDPAPIVRVARRQEHRSEDGAVASPVLCVARWGFLPHWARDASRAARMINARAESVAGSRTYGRAFEQRRCLVPADGWYEWRVEGGQKRPYFMTRPERVVFGGVWSRWRSDNGDGAGHTSLTAESRITFSIITVPAIGELASVHDRMPLVLDISRWRDWFLSSDVSPLLTPTSEYCAGFEIRPVSTAVGDVRKDGPELVRRVTSPTSNPSTVDCSPTLF